MLELKGIDYDLVHVLPGNQRIHLRLAGFRHGTAAARQSGYRRWVTLPSAQATEPLPPVVTPVPVLPEPGMPAPLEHKGPASSRRLAQACHHSNHHTQRHSPNSQSAASQDHKQP